MDTTVTTTTYKVVGFHEKSGSTVEGTTIGKGIISQDAALDLAKREVEGKRGYQFPFTYALVQNERTGEVAYRVEGTATYKARVKLACPFCHAEVVQEKVELPRDEPFIGSYACPSCEHDFYYVVDNTFQPSNHPHIVCLRPSEYLAIRDS